MRNDTMPSLNETPAWLMLSFQKSFQIIEVTISKVTDAGV